MSSDQKYVVRVFLAIFGTLLTFGGLGIFLSAIPQEVLNQQGLSIAALAVGLAMLAVFFLSVRRRRS